MPAQVDPCLRDPVEEHTRARVVRLIAGQAVPHTTARVDQLSQVLAAVRMQVLAVRATLDPADRCFLVQVAQLTPGQVDLPTMALVVAAAGSHLASSRAPADAELPVEVRACL